RPARSPLFPYPTLFRSDRVGVLDPWQAGGVVQTLQQLDVDSGTLADLARGYVVPVVTKRPVGRKHLRGDARAANVVEVEPPGEQDRKSTRLNSSHDQIS